MRKISRGTLLVIISLLICSSIMAVIIFAGSSSENNTNPFKDVNSGTYYYDPVLWAVKYGITDGTSKTTFSPEDTCTRAQTVCFLWRLGGKKISSIENKFYDVKYNEYYYDAVKWAVENGITNGTSSYLFSPNATVTREQFVTFLWRYAGSHSYAGTSQFSDVKQGDYYYKAVVWAAKVGITNGVSSSKFGVGQPCTRADTVTFIYRYAKEFNIDPSIETKDSDTQTTTETEKETEKETTSEVIYKAILPKEGEISNFITALNGTVTSVTNFSSEGRVAKIAPKTSSSAVTININLLEFAKSQSANMKFGRYLVIRYKTYNLSSATLTPKTLTTTVGKSVSLSGKNSLTCNGTWQYLIVDLGNVSFPTEGYAKKLMLTFDPTLASSGGGVYIGKIVMSDKMSEAYSECGLEKFAIVPPDTTIEDPLENVVLTANNENKNVKLWFEQSTEKKTQNDTTSSGKTGFTVYLSKNEVENAQMFISPSSTTNIKITVDPFEDSKGNVLESKLYYEYYHNIQNVLRPDAVIPYSDPITVQGGKSQGFIIKLISDKNTVPGDYYSVVHVFNADTGLEIKRAKVGAHVWNVTLSDETELRTLFGLWGDMLYSSYNHNTCPYSWDELYESAYYFLLDYRINSTSLVRGVDDASMDSALQDPRINSVRSSSDTLISALGGATPSWLSKVLYYPTDADEPRTNAHFTIIRNRCTTIKSDNKNAQIILPFERNLDLTSSGTITDFYSSSCDSIGYMSKYLNVWCPQTIFFTEKELSFMSGTEYPISQLQENKYGSFMDRMNAEVAGGDELWAYVSLNPKEPYCNYLIKSDGTDAVTLMWQMKHYGVKGFLYWAVDYYRVNYWSTSSSWNDTNNGAYGDGILFYPGYKLYQKEPIATIRLEQIRDGIEDYQMLCMLEEVAGKDVCDQFVQMVTTSVVIHTEDDDYLRNVRALLGQTLEEYLSK